MLYPGVMVRAAHSFVTMWRLAVAFVLLLVVAMPALAPTAFAIEHKTGSAFNSATDDVSLPAPISVAELRKAPALRTPVLPAVAVVSLLAVPLVIGQGNARSGQREPRGPPPAETIFSPLVQTGPPTA